MTPFAWILLLVAGLASWLLTGQIRRYALSREMLDVPNERSAHTAPVPRGGGLAIVVVTLLGTGVAAALGWLAPRTAFALAGGLPIALVGWLDDRFQISAVVRAAIHASAAVWAVSWLGGFPAMVIGNTVIELHLAGPVLAVLTVIWVTNLFNFMDGIDGMAAGVSVAAGAVGGMLLFLTGAEGLAWIALLVAATSAGFLGWNWSPARIFMGDVGSAFLGFVFAVLTIASENGRAVPAVLWVLLLGVFIFDSTTTLARRVVRGERWYAAHNSHAYQRAVQSGLSHARVSGTTVIATLALGLLVGVTLNRPSWTLAVMLTELLLLAVIYWAIERRRPMSRN